MASRDGMIAAGQVKVLYDSGLAWVQLGQDLNGSEYDYFGGSVDIAGNGKRICAHGGSAQVTIFEYSESTWVQVHQQMNSGYKTRMSSDGSIVVIGYSTGTSTAGEVKVFKDNGLEWVQVGGNIIGEAARDYLGSSVTRNVDR